MCQALNIPPALKYESDGGPDMERIMTLLLGSANALTDRLLFLKTQVLFWLLCAIDGHAKNFSIVLMPGGSYQLAPIYDVMSAYPLLAKRQIDPQKMKMVMAVKGKGSHYHWDKILYRHWLSTAQACRFPVDEMESIIRELLEKMDGVIAQVETELTAFFPDEVARFMFDGMKNARDRLLR
jgi:serine/threonine-protein kinase HipA